MTWPTYPSLNFLNNLIEYRISSFKIFLGESMSIFLDKSFLELFLIMRTHLHKTPWSASKEARKGLCKIYIQKNCSQLSHSSQSTASSSLSLVFLVYVQSSASFEISGNIILRSRKMAEIFIEKLNLSFELQVFWSRREIQHTAKKYNCEVPASSVKALSSNTFKCHIFPSYRGCTYNAYAILRVCLDWEIFCQIKNILTTSWIWRQLENKK